MRRRGFQSRHKVSTEREPWGEERDPFIWLRSQCGCVGDVGCILVRVIPPSLLYCILRTSKGIRNLVSRCLGLLQQHAGARRTENNSLKISLNWVKPQLYSFNLLRRSLCFGIEHIPDDTTANTSWKTTRCVVVLCYRDALINVALFKGLLVDLYVPRKCAATSE